MSILVEGIGLPVNGCLGCHYRTGEFCGILEHHDRVWEYAEMFERNPYCPIKELIHCKDCVHWRKSNFFDNTMACHYVIGHEYYREADDYCSQAERKEE